MRATFTFICLFIATLGFSQIRKQMIFNEVPIHFTRNVDMALYWQNPALVISQYEKNLNINGLSVEMHYNFIQFILEGVKAGKITIYQPDQYIFNLSPDEYFKTSIPIKGVDFENFTYNDDEAPPLAFEALYQVSYVAMINEYDELMYDEETGDALYETVLSPLRVEEFVSITFVEEWEFDSENLIFQKKVLGMSFNTVKTNKMTGDITGIQPRFYVKMNPFDKSNSSWEIANNLNTSSNIGGKLNGKIEDTQQLWWNENIESSKRYNLIQPLLNGKQAYLIPERPYDKPVNDINKALYGYYDIEKYDEEWDEPMYDEFGDFIYVTDSFQLNYLDIPKLGFIEDWYFDTINLSFGKTIKGLIPYKKTTNEIGEVSGTIPTFLVTVNNQKIENTPKNFNFKNLLSSTSLINNQLSSLSFVSDSNILRNNNIVMDTSVANAMKTAFIEKGNEASFEIYSVNYLTKIFVLQKNKKLIMGEYVLIVKMDEDSEPIYDADTGDVIYDTIYISYKQNDIVGMSFFEDWSYDINQNKFNIDVKGVMPGVLATSPETGDILGVKTLYMKKNINSDLSNFQLIKSDYSFTFNVSEYYSYAYDFWLFSGNTGYMYPQQRKELIEALFEGIQNKKVKVYNAITNEKINPKSRVELVENISFRDIETIELTEDVYIDFNTLNFKKEVTSITLYLTTIEKIDTLGDGLEIIEERSEFPWIKIIFVSK